MKLSSYNFIFPYNTNEDTKNLIFNARTGAMATLDEEHSNSFNDFIDKNIFIEDEVFLSQLKEGGFVIDKSVNELELIKLRLLQNRYNSNYLTLTIAPTMNCNFACVYCYEKDSIKNIKMDNKVKNAIVNYISKKVEGIERLHIAWYGGEPLLAFDIIEELSEKIMKICEENSVSYSANIVTNGYLLSGDIAKKFREFHINSTQITLDGPEDIHDKRRPLINGTGTYNKIMNNIKNTIDYIDNLSIRINTDMDNSDRIHEVIENLKEHGIENKVYPYLGFVASTNDSYVEDKCMTVEMYSKKSLEFTKKNGLELLSRYPRIIGNYCGADYINSIIFDPMGAIYKCWNDIGIIDNSVGNIKDENVDIIANRVYLDYMLFDPTEDMKCKSCEFLPICMGGCPHKRRSKTDGCCDHKFTLDEYLIECANEIIARREQQATK